MPSLARAIFDACAPLWTEASLAYPRLPQTLAVSALVAFVLANVGANVASQNQRFQAESVPSVRMYDGTNHLIRKCAIVAPRRVRSWAGTLRLSRAR